MQATSPDAPAPTAMAAPTAIIVTTNRLLERCAGGDEDAFAQLYDRVAPAVYGIARGVLVDPSMAEEVTQEVLLNVWVNAASFDPARGSARAWILLQAHRRAVDAVRSEQALRNRVDRVATAAFERPFDVVADAVVERASDHSLSRDLKRAMATLTTLQQTAIELAYYKGLTYRQVAEVLGVPVNTAKTRIRDGMLRLAKHLTPLAEGSAQ